MKAQDNNSMLVLFVWDLACNVLRHHTIMIFNAVDTSLTARLTVTLKQQHCLTCGTNPPASSWSRFL